MSGLRVMIGKEITEFLRTWRVWLLGLVWLFNALSGPPLARWTPELMASLAPELQLQLPDPTFWDSWGQWAKNLTQLNIVVLLICFAGMIATELRNQTAVLVLTKPVSRAAFVIAKVSVAVFFVIVFTALAALITGAFTAVLFPEPNFVPLIKATAIWLVLALLMIAVLALASVLTGSTMAAAGIGFGVFALLSVASMWGPARNYSPAGLADLIGKASTGNELAALWPVLTSVLLAFVLIGLAVHFFNRKDL